MKHLKLTAALLAAVMSISMFMTPVVADETEVPSETQTTETAEETEAEESEENEPEIVEKPGEPEAEAKNDALDAVLAKGKCGKKVKWSLDKKGTLKITGKGAMKNYAMNASGKSTAPWTKYASKIKKVVISKKVTKVGDFAFCMCPNLKSISLPKKLKSIGSYAFTMCSNLTKVSIPKKVKTIGEGAFGVTGIVSVVLPNSVQRIGDSAFRMCPYLKSVKIPASVKTIGRNAFADCTKLETVSIPIAGATTIGEFAFDGCASLKSFKIPLTVTTLGSFAFNNCTNLEDAWISSKLYAKSTGTFNGCSNLKAGKPEYYPYADINETIEDQGPFHFKVTYPEINGNGTVTVTEYDPTAEKVVFPNVVVYKGVSYKVTRIERNAAVTENKNLKTVVIGSNVTSIADNAFSNCPELVSVTGGAKLVTIGARAFANCPKLKVFSISSKSLKKIGAYAFNADKALTTLQVKKTTKLTKSGVKKSLKGSSVKTVKVKKSKVKKYKKIFKKKNCGKKVKVKK